MAVLLVLFPLASVLGSIEVAIRSLAVRLVVLPVSVVHVTIGVYQSALAVRLARNPVTLVHGAIRPDLNAPALANAGASQPLSFVARSVLQNLQAAFFPHAQLTLEGCVVVDERP